MKNLKLNCHIDNRSFKEKPSIKAHGQYVFAEIKNRLMKSEALQLSPKELMDQIGTGHIFLTGHMNDRSKYVSGNMKDINFIALDIDNQFDRSLVNKKFKKGEGTYDSLVTIKEAEQQIAEVINAHPFGSYITFTGFNGDDVDSIRFRLLYALEENATEEEIAILLAHLNRELPMLLDANIAQATRIVYPTCNETMLYNDYKLIEKGMVDYLVSIHEEEKETEKTERENRNYGTDYEGDGSIESLKQVPPEVYFNDIGNFHMTATGNGYRMACPLHEGNNETAFSIYFIEDGTWLWTCFTSDCGTGDIIKFHMKYFDMARSEAIKDLKRMYKLETQNPLFKDDINLTIDKYISDDKDAIELILEVIEDNKKTLITSPMGTGKTHLVLNDIYDFTNNKDKTLLIVIPSVSQLDNLSKNKGIKVVHGETEGYFGEDIVATTPESALAIAEEIGKDNFILAMDESHERYIADYRVAFKYGYIDNIEKLAHKSIHFTATPTTLAGEKFDKVICIKSENLISNKISGYTVNKAHIEDALLEITESMYKDNRQVVVFRDNKDKNKELKDKLISKYENIQVETVSSEEKSEDVMKGKLIKDITITTSAITAGIDLETKEDAVLIVDTSSILPDTLVQMIGRYRKGIEVIQLVEKRNYIAETKNIFDLIANNIKSSECLRDLANKSEDFRFALRFKNEIAGIENGQVVKGSLEESSDLKFNEDTKQYEVNYISLVTKTYKHWGKSVMSNIEEIEKTLEEQQAFEVSKFIYHGDFVPLLDEMKELSKLNRREKKKLIDKKVAELLEFEDYRLEILISGEVENATTLDVLLYESYKELAPQHIEKIKSSIKYFCEDETYPLAMMFRKFHNQSWTSILDEIDQFNAIEINKELRECDKRVYLSKAANNYRYKRSTDMVQVKIRSELEEVEKKQGRLTIKVFDKLLQTLVNESYIYNKSVSIYKDAGSKEEEKAKALQEIEKLLSKKLNHIYNLTLDNRISSIKTKL